MSSDLLKQALCKTFSDKAYLGYLAFDKKTGACVYTNQQALEILELPNSNKLDSLKLSNLYPKKDNRRKSHPFDASLTEQDGLYQDILIQKANGQIFIAHLGVRQSSIEGKDYILLMIREMTIQAKLQRDLTEKQNAITTAYEELLVQNEQLKDLDIAKTRFIALTTHELRTPLSAIYASAEVLKLKLYDNDEQREEFVDMIYEQGAHMLELVNDILDFAKIQSGKMDYYIEELNVCELLQHQIEGLQSMATENEVSLELDSSVQETLCYFDSMRLKQVLNNIVNNAIKYNKPQGSVKVWLEADEKEVKVLVKDTGKGIAAEQLLQVFDEFETLGKVSQHSKGTGLGMPISKRLIESMGGQIALESEVDVGTTFWITIPCTKVLDEENYRSRPEDNFDLAA